MTKKLKLTDKNVKRLSEKQKRQEEERAEEFISRLRSSAWIERQTSNLNVPGSNPGGGA